MAGSTRFGVVTLLGIALMAGCSKGTSVDAKITGSNAPKSAPAAPQLDPKTQPIAHAASDFLDAMLKGDTQRCSARLTPQAMQRIIASGKQFNPPGLETDSFRVGQVQAPAEDQAIVQCFYIAKTKRVTHEEEMCCVMRRIDNDWRVAGLAYGVNPDQPWTLMDFESGQTGSIPRQTMSPTNSGMAVHDGATRQSPARTAKEAPATELR